MKKIQPFLFAAMLFIYLPVYAQVGIGTATPNASAKLDITSTIRLGFRVFRNHGGGEVCL